MDLVEYALEKEQDDMIFLRWCIGYQTISFEEFKRSLQPTKQKSDNAVFEDVEQILNAMR